jgi:superfamily II DNA or RNA helicase
VIAVGFHELELKKEYRSFSDDIVNVFYIPLLKNAVVYQRAVGFFSSSALIEISYGITELLKNGGKIQLIASPRLQKDDIDAIEKGYKERNAIIEKVIMESFTEPKNYFEEQRLNLLATLVAEGRLDIKIAFIADKKSIGMYHEKVGLIHDNSGNVVAFTGSMNETSTAFSHNYETIDVFCSWTEDIERVASKQASFNALWNDYEPRMYTLDFPQIAREKLQSYRTENLNLDLDKEEFSRKVYRQKGPYLPKEIRLHDYQVTAINEWEKQNYIGIFDMATGTGKTYTGLSAVSRLFETCKHKLAVIIVCPYQHLVEQWVTDIVLFGMKPIVGYSTSSQKNWKERLKDSVTSYNLEIMDHFCFVTTNATFSSDFVMEQINALKGNVVILADEAHNFGAAKLSKTLNLKIPYRLALSATLERHGDEEGTQRIYNYFGKKCIEYTLKMAIDEGKLTPYYYYPIKVYLSDVELMDYKKLTNQIAKECRKDNKNKIKVSDRGKMLLIKRAQLVAAASEKISRLKEEMIQYKDEKHILVYCGASTMSDPNYTEGSFEEYEKRQIDIVSDVLGNQLGMKISQFTSSESSLERERLKVEFDEAKHLQALVAIRCLDEGVNIPSIKFAFILASSTNPKEYIQRRGRVLRKYTGKNFAIIYDFITLPRRLNEVKSLSPEEIKIDVGLVKREMIRMKDFAEIAENSSVADELINEINNVYDLNKIEGVDNYD